MQQMKQGTTKFTKNPQLTVFPIGNNSTPGLIANSLYQIYTPTHANKSVNIELKEVKEVETVGSGEREERRRK